LLTVARLLNRPALLETRPPQSEMTIYYVHPDGEVVTEASRRQDRYQRGSMARYYYSYRYLALRDGSGRFAAVTRSDRTQCSRTLSGELVNLLTEPELLARAPADEALPTDYAKVFSYSNLARIRRGTAAAQSSRATRRCFSFPQGQRGTRGRAARQRVLRQGTIHQRRFSLVRDAFTFSGRNLRARITSRCSAAQIADGEHVRMAPNARLPPTVAPPRRSNVQNYDAVVEITERDGKFTLAISVTGTADVPVAIELAFRAGGTLRGSRPSRKSRTRFSSPAATAPMPSATTRLRLARPHENSYTQVRGALPKWEGQSVYLTGFTPFKTTLTIS